MRQETRYKSGVSSSDMMSSRPAWAIKWDLAPWRKKEKEKEKRKKESPSVIPPSTFLPAGRDLLGAAVVDRTEKRDSVTQSLGEHSLGLPSREAKSSPSASLRQQAPALSDFYPHPRGPWRMSSLKRSKQRRTELSAVREEQVWFLSLRQRP